MAIELVNGYVCRNCTDVGLAKRGVDPAHPHDPPHALRRPDGAAADPSTAPGSDAAAAPDGVNRPVADGDRGTLLNLAA
jgi:hypothetical protein